MQQHKGEAYLRGRKVNLRALRKEDAQACTRWVNDPEIAEFIGAQPFPMTIENEEKWIASMNSSDRSTLMLAIETSEGVYIGNMGLHNINWRDRTATTGTLIGEKNYWGKGFGTEAKILLLRHAFHTMNLRKICSQVIEFNGRSKRYSEKCGYKSEGVLRQHTFRRGRYWDLENLAVFAEDFATVWERYEGGEF